MKNRALFLDRDGVINIDGGHVFEIEKFHFMPGIFDLCQKLQNLGYIIIVITNQAGIAKGYYSVEQFLKLNAWMENEFLKNHIMINKTYFCPYHQAAETQSGYDFKGN
jgi:D-glycero-D-manno-heptose 1,7-bisphosphate phosphatase